MKNLIAILALMTSFSAFAEEPVERCHLANNPDAGYEVDIYAGNPMTATIKRVGLMVPRTIGQFEVKPIGLNAGGISGYEGNQFRLTLIGGRVTLSAQTEDGSVNSTGPQGALNNCNKSSN